MSVSRVGYCFVGRVTQKLVSDRTGKAVEPDGSVAWLGELYVNRATGLKNVFRHLGFSCNDAVHQQLERCRSDKIR